MVDQKTPEEAWGRLPLYSAEFAKAVVDRFEAKQERFKASRLHERTQRAWQQLYSRDKDGNCDLTLIQVQGSRGEVLKLQSNRFARILKDQQADIRQSPPEFVPQALNSSSKAQDQTKLAMGLLRYYRKILDLDAMRVHRVEVMQIASESAQHVYWDPQRGDPVAVSNAPGEIESPAEDAAEGGEAQAAAVDPADRKLVYEGDFVTSVRSPYDYAMDPTGPNRRRPRWGIVREPADRYDTIATYVEAEAGAGDKASLAERKRAILDCESWSKRMSSWKYETQEIKFDDSIPVFYVYIERSAAVPEGRQAIVLDNKHVLLDGPLGEERMGVFLQRSRDVMFRSDEAHSDAYDGLPLAEAHSATLSTMLSNFDAHGLNRWAVARESNFDEAEMQNGLGIAYYDARSPGSESPNPPPIPLMPNPVSGESFTLKEMLDYELDTVLGGSAVRRGDPSASKGDSGSKTAMLYAAAQTSASPLVTSTLDVDAEIATFMISALRRHVSVKRLTTIVGDKNDFIAKEYVGSDLQEIAQVTVEPANPARNAFEGRMAVAELIKDAKTPEERDYLLSMVNTGQGESALDPFEAERMLIERENTLLAQGKDVPVDPFDNHMQHLASHKQEKADPEVRNDPARMKPIDDHMQWHLEALTPGAPRFAGYMVLQGTGQTPLAPPPPPPGMAQGIGAPPGSPPVSGSAGGPQGKPIAPGGAPDEKKGKAGPMPDMPKPPVDASTGQRMPIAVPSAPNVGG